MFQIDFSSRVPIYEQLYSGVIKLASAGVLKEGDKLPPVRNLATQLGINPNTVAKSYKLLEADGYIFTSVGRGSFVTQKLGADAARLLEMDNFRQTVRHANFYGVDRNELIDIINKIYDGGDLND